MLKREQMKQQKKNTSQAYQVGTRAVSAMAKYLPACLTINETGNKLCCTDASVGDFVSFQGLVPTNV